MVRYAADESGRPPEDLPTPQQATSAQHYVALRNHQHTTQTSALFPLTPPHPSRINRPVENLRE